MANGQNGQKLKKVLNKLAGFAPKAKTSSKAPAMAAKKATPVKKKSQPVAAKKADKGGKKPAPKVAAGSALKKAAKVGKSTAKPSAPAKTVAKGKAPAPAVKSAVKKKAGTASAPTHKVPSKAMTQDRSGEKAGAKKAAAPVATPAPKKAEKPVAAKPVEATKTAPKTDAPAPEPKTDVEAAPKTDAKAKAKTKREREDEARAEADVPEEEIVLTDAEGRRYCRVKDCDQASVVDGYCRYHYLLFWKNIQGRKKILSEGKLERYIEELTARYPDKYLEMLRKDLRSEKEFLAAIQELEIDDNAVDSEYEDEAQSYLDEVRGMSSEGGTREEEDF